MSDRQTTPDTENKHEETSSEQLEEGSSEQLEEGSSEELEETPIIESREEDRGEEDKIEAASENAEDLTEEGVAEEEAGEASEEEEPDSPNNDYKSGRRFDEMPLTREVIEGLKSLGYEEATQVQAATIEPGLAGKDLLVRAKTGTGKTCAFCVPIVERLEEGARYPQAIILSPTRELATQIAEECAGIARYKDLRILAVYGGVAMGPQETAFKEGVDIIVGTPGRVLDHIRRKNLDLSRCKITCLDEADEMLSMGFYEDVNNILKATADGAQVLLFSATVEERVKRLIRNHLNDPVDILLSTDADKVEGIEHILYETTPNFHRVRALLAIIDQEQPGSTIIFCNTREDTSTVANFLSRQGLDAQLISGELPQNKRTQVMQKVKSGEIQFLVATDVAARGIDISDVTHVLNYSLPADPPVYMHRIGRTGRIGKKGKAISMVGGPDLATRNVLERQFKINFNCKELPTPEEAAALRVNRQSLRLETAMGTTAFEAYLPLVKALKERENGEFLLATALRIFFQWDREQQLRGSIDTLGALSEARQEKRDGRRDGGGGRGGRDGGGGRGRSGGRGRGGGRDGGGRDGGGRDGGGRDGGGRGRGGGGGGGGEAKAQAPRSEGGGDAPRKRRRRRRRSGSSSGGSSE